MKLLKTIIVYILTMFVVFMGSVGLTYYIVSGVTFKSVFVGALGITLLFPALSKWEERFNKILKREK